MVLPERLARFNRVVTNRVTRPFVGWLPGFGMIIHRGRRSGREFRTPLNVFRSGDGFVVALTYGPDTDWVKNVLAAGRAELLTGCRKYDVVDPQLVHDGSRRRMPPGVRQFLGLVGVEDFLLLKRG
ncbi:nitroreductase family deazaflavin-dependent oxidoreductase [Amycolatopsis sp. FDAARGOS 1241]|uniref:nitroreductase family deazaflavin-dependent oxidoreductase n=1 Tax=Amycolatopsis sp. FDAARGOS 1241 TaxID=2778070 RepID=UPI001951DB8C|nr:nitroreductase family deazaflavin-dependent oxidoreductase [Amycolatopsis sp. FDAARGOS 1241]QRP46205.1 nitroreductase family deazaflavin-dependent oxidoreductase [Amycolatopsis sp. FDAARGOS 1241]